MQLSMLKGKIHRATVTQAELNYVGSITVDEDFMAKAGNDDYCFAENISVKPYEKEMQKIILYRWNRVYPADLYFDIDLKNWHLKESNDFAGSSHDKITEEIYVK